MSRETRRAWGTVVEVELTRKPDARVAEILRQLLSNDDIVYPAVPDAAAVVELAAGIATGAERVFVRPFPPSNFAAIA